MAAIASGMSVTQATTFFPLLSSASSVLLCIIDWSGTNKRIWRRARRLVACWWPLGLLRKITPEQETLLRAQLPHHPNTTIAEHLALWHYQHKHQYKQWISPSTMRRAIVRLNWSRKKSVGA